jgi:hypothetical protein
VSKKKPKTINASYPLSFMGCEGEVIVEMTPTEAVSTIEKAWQENKRLRQENATITAERDEARRLCCEHAAMDEGGYVKHGTMLHFAESRGWDCFQQEDEPCQ